MLQTSPVSECNTKRHKHLSKSPVSSKLTFDAVLFDLFDTLVLIDDGDISHLQSLLKMHSFLSSNGLDCSFDDFKWAYLKIVNNIAAETSLTLQEPHFSVYVDRTLADLGAKLKAQNHLVLQAVDEFSSEFMHHISVDPDALEVLKYLHKRCKTAVISNLTFSESAWKILEYFELTKYLDLIVVSGDVNMRKPHPQIFNMSLRYLGIKPSQALFVGDTLETDVLGAKNVGLTSVQIVRKPSICSIIKPHFKVTALKQLLTVFDFPELVHESMSFGQDVACEV